MPENNIGQRVAEQVLKYRWWVLIGSIAFVMAAGSGARFLGMSTDYRVFFSKENPQLTAFDELEKRYSKNDNILIALAPKDGKVFTPKTLEAVKELTWSAWKLPYSSRVDSITNFQYTRADDDELIVEDLVKNPKSLSNTDLKRIEQIALSEPLLLNRLISPEAHVTGINVTFQQPGKTIFEVPEIVKVARKMADEFRQKYPDIDIYLSGMVMLNNAFSEGAQGDMGTLMPLMFMIMTIIIWFSIRSISGTVTTMIVIIMSMATAMGIAGWLGILITPPSATAPTIVMTLAIADSIHILVTMFHEMKRGKNKREAIIESIRVNMQPIFLTSVTTAIGFLTMNFSDSPPFHDLGNIVAVGVIAAFAYSILILPVLMSFLPVRIKKQENGEKMFMDRFGDFVVNKRKQLFWGMAIFILMLFTGMSRIEFYDIFSEYFDHRYAFRVDTDFIKDNLTGLDLVEYSLEAKEDGGVSAPEYLAKLEAFSKWFEKQPEVLQVNSFSTIMKRLNKNMHGDDPSYYKVPENKELAAQYLLLYEMSLPFGMDINNQINISKSATRFSVTLKRITSNEIRQIAERGENWLKKNAPAYMAAIGIGPTVMFSYISQRNIVSMLGGTTVALVLISGILIFALRSFKIGIISLIPNLVPAGMAFGLWGFAVGQVGLGLSVVSAMCLGIVVDDTVHFLSKYIRARREHGMDSTEAVRYSFNTVGKALWITSVILVIGFFVLSFSGFKMNSEMGLLTAVAIIFALLADFLFLPPLLMKMDKGKSKEFVREQLPDKTLPGIKETKPI